MTMSAVVMRRGNLELIEAPIPRPGYGEVLVQTLATGICGSDLHCASHGAELVAGARAVSGIELFDLDEAIVMGHEFCAAVVEYGPGCRETLPLGARVVSVPILLSLDPPMWWGVGWVVMTKCPVVVEEWDFSRITFGHNEGHLVDAILSHSPGSFSML